MNHRPSGHPRLAIINLHSAFNGGDFILFQVLLEQLKQHFPDSHFVLVANDPDSFRNSCSSRTEVVGSFFAWLKGMAGNGGVRLAKWGCVFRALMALALEILIFRSTGKRVRVVRDSDLRLLLDAFWEADGIISCPGNFIYSRAHLGGLPLLGPLSLLLFAWCLRKPFWLAPQTIGPLWRWWERWLVGWVLRRSKFILVRDPLSVELLSRLRISASHYRVLPDLAFLYNGANHEEARRLFTRLGIPFEEGPYLGVTLIHWQAQHPRFQGQARYEDGIIYLVQAFLEDHPDGHVILFSQVCGPTWADDDRIPARRVWMQLHKHPKAAQVHYIAEPLPPDVLRAAYLRMDLFVGSRLHSNIFALTGGVPVLAIAYQEKTFGVMRMLGLERWTVDITEAEGVVLVERYRALWQEKTYWEAYIRKTVAACNEVLEKKLGDILSVIQYNNCKQ